MDSRKAFPAMPGGITPTTAIPSYSDSTDHEKSVESANDDANSAGDTAGSVANATYRLQKMSEDIDRMINEGGIAG